MLFRMVITAHHQGFVFMLITTICVFLRLCVSGIKLGSATPSVCRECTYSYPMFTNPLILQRALTHSHTHPERGPWLRRSHHPPQLTCHQGRRAPRREKNGIKQQEKVDDVTAVSRSAGPISHVNVSRANMSANASTLERGSRSR